MSAKRFSGNATITVTYDEGQKRPNEDWNREYYRATVAQGRKRVTMRIGRPLVHGSGVGVDSPAAFDEIASSALSFATHDEKIDEDELEFGDEGYIVHRKRQPWHTQEESLKGIQS